jgi:hypothetical protein
MTKIKQKLIEFLKLRQSSELEQFINSKRPTNTAEVEFWLNQYNRQMYAREL